MGDTNTKGGNWRRLFLLSVCVAETVLICVMFAITPWYKNKEKKCTYPQQRLRQIVPAKDMSETPWWCCKKGKLLELDLNQMYIYNIKLLHYKLNWITHYILFFCYRRWSCTENDCEIKKFNKTTTDGRMTLVNLNCA